MKEEYIDDNNVDVFLYLSSRIFSLAMDWWRNGQRQDCLIFSEPYCSSSELISSRVYGNTP